MANAKKSRIIKQSGLLADKVNRAMAVVRSRVSPRFYQLLAAEARNKNISSRGRRYSKEEKLDALAMFHRGKRLYIYLRNTHLSSLPSPSTLRMFRKKVQLNTGINPTLFAAVEKKTKGLSSKDVILMWDEVSLKKSLTYNKHFDVIEGLPIMETDNGRIK